MQLQKCVGEDHVSGAADWQPFGNALDDTKNYHFQNFNLFHKVSVSYYFVSIGRSFHYSISVGKIEVKYEKNFQYLSTDGKTIGEVERKLNLETQVQAPVKEGDVAGTLEYYQNGQKLGEVNILFSETIEKATYKNCLEKLLKLL